MLRKLFCLITFTVLIGCSTNYKEANKEAVERFRTQLVQSEFQEIYDHSENNLRHFISKEEFIGNIKLAVERMKEFDGFLNWQQDEAADEWRVKEVYSYRDASWRTMEKNGKRLNITIWWGENFTFCDLTINEDNSNKPETVVSRCSKS